MGLIVSVFKFLLAVAVLVALFGQAEDVGPVVTTLFNAIWDGVAAIVGAGAGKLNGG